MMASSQSASGKVSRLMGDLVPNIVDQRANDEPDMLYAEYPVSTLSYEQGYRRITYRDFANAINGLSWWLHDVLGPGQDFETLAYIGPNDLRYAALILAAAKAGYVMFLPSPRNSVTAQSSLLVRVKCKTLLTPNPRPLAVTTLLAVYKIRVVEVPNVDWLLDRAHRAFPYGKTFLKALNEPFVTVHTSGSTGLPKPLVYTHATAAANTKMFSLEPPPGFESLDMIYQGKRVFNTFPPFHGAYLVSYLFNAVPFGTVMIAPTPGTIASAEGLFEALKKTPADIAFIVPSIVQELSQSPELLDYCAKHLEAIIYCGGDLPESIGNVVASKVKLFNQFGATELGQPAQILSNHDRGPGDWKYAQFHPDIGIQLRELTDGVYELYAIRDDRKKDQQPTFTIFPDAQEYASRDLFVRHPSKEKSDLWCWRARADDIIVFLNGEKTNPISMEQYVVSQRPEIAVALVVGAQRFQAALLIEPAENEKHLSPAERAAFIEQVWPTIEEANKDAPAHARVVKSHVLLTHPQKPMLRAGKGTVQRSGTLRLYADEIESLYADADTMSADAEGHGLDTVNCLDDTAVYQFIKKSVLSITKWPDLDDNENFFTLGMDSLQALLLVREFRRGLAIPSVALTTVYTNPSLSALTKAILRCSRHQQESKAFQEQERHQRIGIFLNEYQEKIDRLPTSPTAVQETPNRVVILTGSTGALGSHILHTLLANPITHIYCLNRATDSLARQEQRNQSYGLGTQLDACRVTFLTANLSQENLGLQQEILHKLMSTATHIIHNAWPVNFNLSLPAFRTQLDGLVNLIGFTAKATMSPHLFFISSISSVMSYGSSAQSIPEEVISTDSSPGPNGYAESKYLSERLLDYAAQKLSIDTAFARVGQIAGPVSHAGLWNKAEWFPSLVISSLHVGAIPDSLGPTMGNIDWVPIDDLAKVLVDLAVNGPQSHQQTPTNENTQQTRAQVFHPLNPHPTTWQAVLPVVASELSSILESKNKEPLQIISLASWLLKIRKDVETAASSHHDKSLADTDLETLLQVNPAVKLLAFYEEVLGSKEGSGRSWDMQKTMERSAKVRALEGIRAEWVRKWVREWFAGME